MSNNLMFEFIKRMYLTGIYVEEDLQVLVDGGLITQEEMQLIIDSKPQ